MRKSILLAACTALLLTGPALSQTPAAKGSTSLVPPADAPPIKNGTAGPYKVAVEKAPGLEKSHTLYRPADLSAFTGAKKLPVIAWGNGACSNAGLLFENFLTDIVSHGYVVIVSGPMDAPLPGFAKRGQAVHSPPPAVPGAPPQPMTTDADMKHGLDWAEAQAADPKSLLYGHIDTGKMAVMGQSCGGLQATANAADPRVKTVVIWNSGVFNTPGVVPGSTTPTRSLSGATKDGLAKIHTPIAYINGGPADAAYENSKDDVSRIKAVPVFHAWVNVGHGGTYDHPNGGRFGDAGVAWLDWQLKGVAADAKMFTGKDCTLCKDPAWHVEKPIG
jgi:dienelactone hydrolase